MTKTAAATGAPGVTSERHSPVSRGTTLIVLASLFFGTSGPLVKPTMDAGLSPQQVASFRICLAALLLLAFVAVRRPALLRVRARDWRLLLAYGLVCVAGVQLLYFAAVSRIPIGVAMLLEFTSPILVALWVRFVRKVILPPRMWVGTALALAGLGMVAEVWQGLRLDAIGLLLGIGAALCASAYFLMGERAVAAIEPLGLVTWGMVIGGVGIAVIAPPWTLPGDVLAEGAGFGPWTVPVWGLLVACAVLSTAVAYLLSISSMQYLPANVISVLALVEPIFATVLAWVAIGQALSAAQIIGAVVLLSGATIVQFASRTAPTSIPSADPVHPQG